MMAALAFAPDPIPRCCTECCTAELGSQSCFILNCGNVGAKTDSLGRPRAKTQFRPRRTNRGLTLMAGPRRSGLDSQIGRLLVQTRRAAISKNGCWSARDRATVNFFAEVVVATSPFLLAALMTARIRTAG